MKLLINKTSLLGLLTTLICALASAAPTGAAVQKSVGAPEVSVDEILLKKLGEGLQKKFAETLETTEAKVQVQILNPKFSYEEFKGTVVSLILHGVGAVGSSRPEGLMSFPFTILTSEGSLEAQFQGLVSVVGPVMVSKDLLPRGHIIRETDLVLMQMPWRSIPSRVLGRTAKEFVGLELKATVPAGSYIHPELLKESAMIKTGEQVELLLYSSPGVLIKSNAISQEDGQQGELIHVMHPQSKKILKAKIVSQGSVEVRL